MKIYRLEPKRRTSDEVSAHAQHWSDPGQYHPNTKDKHYCFVIFSSTWNVSQSGKVSQLCADLSQSYLMHAAQAEPAQDKRKEIWGKPRNEKALRAFLLRNFGNSLKW